MMDRSNTLSARLLQYIRDNPGATGSEIHAHFRPPATKASVSATLGRLQRMGLIKNQDHTSSRWSVWYPIEFEKVDPKYTALAESLFDDMLRVPKSEHVDLIARAFCLFERHIQEEKKLC